MSGRADQWIRWTTTACVGLLALIAGIVSYLHMHMFVALHGQPGWVAVLTPLSVDGMIVAASTPLLSDSRSGSRGGVLPWALLVVGSVASLAANVAVAEPTVTGRVIAAWPSFALIAAYELLMRQVRHGAAHGVAFTSGRPRPQSPSHEAPASAQSSNRNHPSRASRQRKSAAAFGSAAGTVAVGTGKPCEGWLATEREGDRPPVRPPRALGPPRQTRGQQVSSVSETRPMTAVVTKKRYWQPPRRDQRLVRASS